MIKRVSAIVLVLVTVIGLLPIMPASTGFPDALAGGVLAAANQAMTVLAAPDEPLSAEQQEFIGNYLDSCSRKKIIIFGGTAAVPEAIENKLKTLVP